MHEYGGGISWRSLCGFPISSGTPVSCSRLAWHLPSFDPCGERTDYALPIQHRDLYNMLYQLAVKEGVEFRFNSTIVDADNVAVSVTLDSDEVLYADVIIGADGFDSLLRQVVTDSGDEPPDVTDTHVIATFLIPVHLMEDDEDLRMLLNARNVSDFPEV